MVFEFLNRGRPQSIINIISHYCDTQTLYMMSCFPPTDAAWCAAHPGPWWAAYWWGLRHVLVSRWSREGNFWAQSENCWQQIHWTAHGMMKRGRERRVSVLGVYVILMLFRCMFIMTRVRPKPFFFLLLIIMLCYLSTSCEVHCHAPRLKLWLVLTVYVSCMFVYFAFNSTFSCDECVFWH